jgi:glycerol-1-phosphate dehydrogenase [NAD(P)+]
VQPFHQQIREEMEILRTSPAIYRSRLENARSHRGRITDLAGELLAELEQAVNVLGELSFPFSLSEYRIDPRQALVPVRYIRFLRNRYSTFNLIHETGAEGRVLGLLERQTGTFS